MENLKFSIMIPVYNVEKYLHECINSVLRQEYKNKEIILVDDGSTDNSGRICDEYANKFSFIKVVHQKNLGQYQARKKALEYANGDFCIYLDSDDFWEDILLKEVAKVILETQCDVVIFDSRDVYENKLVEIKLNFENGKVFEGTEKLALYKIFLEESKMGNLVFKAFKRELVTACNDGGLFAGVCYGEDAYESAKILIKADRIAYLSKCLYNYRKNVGVTKSVCPDFIEKITYAKSKIWELFRAEKINMQESEKKAMLSYMKGNVRNIIYSYIASPDLFKKSFRRVVNTPFYINARKFAYPRLNLFEKMMINCAERERYLFIRIIGFINEIRNRIKN